MRSTLLLEIVSFCEARFRLYSHIFVLPAHALSTRLVRSRVNLRLLKTQQVDKY